MAKETERLAQAFAARDEIESFLGNLKKLRADGSISEEQFAEMEGEYNRRLSAAQSEITGIKSEVKHQLEAKQREKDTYEWEIGKLEVKYKVGELPMDQYLGTDKKLRAEAQALEVECKELNRLIEANSIVDLGVTAEKPQISVSKPSSPARATKPTKQTKPVREKRQELPSPAKINISGGRFNLPQVNLLAVAGGLLLLISVFLPWIAASEILGKELGSDSGREVSGFIALAGIGGGLIVIGASFLPVLKLRSILQAVIGFAALLILGYLIFSGALPILNEYARTLIVVREGLYLYIIPAVALIIISWLERRGISYTIA